MTTRVFALPSGTLTVEVERDDTPVGGPPLFGVAARRNPKRAFVFVSNVLGRHVPVSPETMRGVHEQLAFKLEEALPGPVLFVGLAETAIALGAGVFDAYVRATGRADCLYLPSTRHPVSDRILASFTEDHSHATKHLLHVPAVRSVERLLRTCRTLVMVDDEMTTGRTFLNLEHAIRVACPTLENVRKIVIKDWSGSAPGTVQSILAGRYRWDALADAPVVPDPDVDVTARGEAVILAPEWGRQGIASAAGVPTVMGKPGRHLVLGSGEYVWPAYLHALGLERHLKASGAGTVRFGATTRSPIFVGGAISSAFTFADNYGLGIPNHLYNVVPGDFDHITVFSETAPEHFDPAFTKRYAPRYIVPSAPETLAWASA